MKLKSFEKELLTKKINENSLANANEFLDFIPIEVSFPRKDFQDLRKFRIEVNGNKKFILRIAKNLTKLHELYSLATSTFVNITPKVLLFFSEENSDYLLEEFIKGDTIEKVLGKSPEREIELVNAAMKLHENLNLRLVRSTYEDACMEMEELVNQIASFNFITPIDSTLIQSIVLPEVLTLLSKREHFFKRFSQGDFIDRNIIIREDNSLSLIDLEFLHETHFYKEEIMRFFKYSNRLENRSYQDFSVDNADEIYFLLNQIRLISITHKEAFLSASFDPIIHAIFQLIRDESENIKYSRIIRFLNGDYFQLTQEIANRDSEIRRILNSRTFKFGDFFANAFRKIRFIS